MNDIVPEILHQLLFNLARAASAIFQPDSYLYWPHVLSAFFIALFAWRWLSLLSQPRRSWATFFAEYFTARLWWHTSARADYWLYLANAVVVPLVFAIFLLDEWRVSTFMSEAIGLTGTGMMGHSAGIATRMLFTILFFVAYDFGRFVIHCLLHDVPFLWEFHKIHHSAEVLTPMTSFRAHPLELLLMAWGPLLATGVFTVAFNAIVPDRVSVYAFLGTHALLFLFNLIGNLRHSPVWISYGPIVGRWLISPAHHQVHHSYEPRHLGCNRGFELAIWDRMYGTLYVPGQKPENFRLGLGDGSESRYHNVGAMYLLPFAGAARQIGFALRRSLARLSVRHR